MNQKFRVRQDGKTYIFESVNEAAMDTFVGGMLDYDKAEFFTGLTDVNGVEIFEGDTLEYEDRWEPGKWYFFGVVGFGECFTDIQGSVEDTKAMCFCGDKGVLDPIYKYRIIGNEGE